MADDEDRMEQYTPDEEEIKVTPRTPEEELSDQEKLKLELLQLQKMQATSIYPPKDQSRMEQTPVERPVYVPSEMAKPEPPIDLGKLSTAQIRPQEISQEPSPSRDVPVAPRTDYLKTIRAPLAKEIESNPQLKLRLAALLSLENQGAGPAVIESLLNRALYAKRSVEDMAKGGPNSFYGPARVPGLVEGRMNEIASNPKRLKELFDLVQQAYTSNTIKGHTDQGSAGDPNYIKGGPGIDINRERFNDWGGGPGGHAGARAFRMLMNAKARQPDVSVEELRSFLNPTPTAQQTDVVQGGGMESPKAVAQVAALMRGTPIERIQAATELVNRAGAGKSAEVTRGARVPTSRVSHTDMPQGVIPGAEGSIPESNMPIPGMISPGQQALYDASGPSMFSTIDNYQAQNRPPVVTPKPAPPPDLSFLDKLKAVMRSFTAPIPNIGETSEAMADAENAATQQQGEAVKGIAQGIPSGIMAQPVQIVGGVAAPVVGAAGILADSDAAKQTAFDIANRTEDWTKARQGTMGIDPNAVNPAQAVGQAIGENVGPGILRTLKNLGWAGVGETVIGPLAEKAAQNYPIPNLNPISPAHAASVFGAPPLIVNTPGGPVVMNDEKLQGMVYGGLFALGFGAGVSQVSTVVRATKEMRPFGWTGIADLFDPRRDVAGAPGTKASSIPSDIIKGGIIDNYQAMLDIADRQARYDKGKSVGIDPFAADVAKQKWRVQTGSGAGNLINRAIVEGKILTDDFRFDVPVTIKDLHEFSKVKPSFPEYLKMRMIVEHLTNNDIQRRKLQSGKTNPIGKYPDTVEDNFGRTYNLTIAQDKAHRLEQDHPDFVTQHANLQNNLAATRDFISNRNTNWVEHPVALANQAVKMPTAPVFSHKKDPYDFLKSVLAGDNPLSLTETAMRKALANQMKFDAEQHYINNVASSSAFTPRTAEWVRNNPIASENGAVLTRKMGGQVTHWTADPLIVSMLNADHMPVAGWGQAFQTSKNLFQATTTGLFAPWFAPTGMVRAMEQGWATAPVGVKDAQGRTRTAAGPFSTLAAIPAQITPRALNAMSPTVAWFENRIQNSNLGQLIDPKHHNLMSRAMEKAYSDSFYKRMLDAGAYSGTTLQQDRVIHTNITKQKLQNTNPAMAPVHDYMEKVSEIWHKFAWEPTKAVGRGIKETGHAANEVLRSVQEAPNFAWAYKVGKTATDTKRPTIRVGGRERPMSDAELAARMRNYTGDPSTRGFIYSTNPKTNKQETLGYQGPGEGRANFYKAIGVGAHGARMTVPWAGVLAQSPASTIKAMRDNPVRANLAFAASHVMPETAAYLWNMHQTEEDKERALKEGRAPYDYVAYQMQGRGDNPLMNNTYFAPAGGRPPREGVEFKQYQEGILQRYMTRAWWQQYFGLNMHTMREDLAAAAWGMLGGAIIPPQPSWYNAMLGLQGAVSPQGWLGGIQKRRVNPYITLGGGESSLELTARAIVPALADLGIQAYQAGTSAPNWGEVPKAVGQQVGERILERTTGLGDVLGYKPQVAMSTEVSEELWRRKHVIDDLLYRWNVWDINRGDVKQKPASKEGGVSTTPFLPDKPPSYSDMVPNPGNTQTEPQNPLYKMMMGEMQKTFERDMPSKGGIGWKSMWKDYMKYGSLVARMKTVNRGNEAQWLATHDTDKMADTSDYLADHNVDPTNFRQVRDFYAAQHNEVARVMLRTIRATEQRIDQMPEIRKLLGDKHFTVNMLDPNELGIRNPEDVEGHEKSDGR